MFQGWNTAADGSGTSYTNGQSVSTASTGDTLTLYTQWTPIRYSYSDFWVTPADSNTAWAMTRSDVYYEEWFTLHYGGDRSGYTFLYWRYTIDNVTYTNEAKNPSLRNLSTTYDYHIDFTQVFEEDDNGCVADGTLITLADGTQEAVENLDGTEMLLVWNLQTGAFDVAPMIFLDSHGVGTYNITRLYFSDGTYVKVIWEHGFWSVTENKYVYINDDNAEEYIGDWFNKQITSSDGSMSWTTVQLTEVTRSQETTNAWSPITFSHLCYYVNGMLSVPGKTTGVLNIFEVDADTMQYDQEAFQADIEIYGLFDYEEDFAEIIPVEVFYAFNVQYLKVSMGKGNLTQEGLDALITEFNETMERLFA
jgi:hypothetical protein